MLITPAIIRTVHKHGNMTTLHGGGGREGISSLILEIDIFGQDCSLYIKCVLTTDVFVTLDRIFGLAVNFT